ncbi:MAG: hypothetical protein JRJ65_04660 [Deltaproteobacteria bacterium]|nr:hypothetical protein [Deltaproteobacteria bacterium]
MSGPIAGMILKSRNRAIFLIANNRFFLAILAVKGYSFLKELTMISTKLEGFRGIEIVSPQEL